MGLNSIIACIVPVFPLRCDFTGVPEVGERHEFFFTSLDDIEDNKYLRVLYISYYTVPLISHFVIDKPSAAVVKVWESEEIDFLCANYSVGTCITEEIKDRLAWNSISNTVAVFALFLSHPDFFRPDTQAVMKVILSVSAERAAGHIIPIAAVV